jgi:UDP-2,4-diacetamido-2,4,6-trideoxy-beta-L-altropyranose hydrolase
MNLLFRTDASVAIGTGHVMRGLALAQAWQDTGGHAVFAMTEATPAIQARLVAEPFEVLSLCCAAGTLDDSAQTVALAKEQNADWIVVDGYRFTADYQRALKDAGLKVLFLDDYGQAGHYFADIVLNQNLSARTEIYPSREPHTQLLLGPNYCLLRREFTAWRDWKREVSPLGRRVLVTMGGSDPENVTARVVDALALVGVEDLEAVVVMGGSSPHSEMPEFSSAQSGNKISARRDVTNIAELMAWADVAVSSAGTTCWELCLLALPALLVHVAENQTAVARELARRHCAVHLGGPRDFTVEQLAEKLQKLLKSAETRQDISVRCRELVDGRGAWRVASAMRTGLRLRPARESDCRLLWEWANDPQVRGAAFSQAPIPWEQHEVWFASKMGNPNCDILVAQDGEGRAVGQFRVDWRSEEDGEIDVSVSSEFRGAGYGAVLIDLGVNRVFAGEGGQLHAFVKVENHASRRAFEQAGFTILGEVNLRGQPAIHYVRTSERDQASRSNISRSNMRSE